MLPIEEGCLAVIYNDKDGNSGTSVTCMRYLGKHKDYWNSDLWETDTMLKSYYYNSQGHRLKRAPDSCYISERKLLRIDGGKFEEEETEELALLPVNHEGEE